MPLLSLLRWFLGTLAVVAVANVGFALWLSAQVNAEYAAGVRTVEQGDSLSIPIAGFFALTILIAILVNAFVFGRVLVRWLVRRRSAESVQAQTPRGGFPPK